MQTQLTQRIMRLTQRLHLLIPSIQSSGLRLEEEALRAKLEETEEEMRRARMKGLLNELWALIGAPGAGVKAGTSAAGVGGRWWTRRVSRRLRKYWPGCRPSCNIG